MICRICSLFFKETETMVDLFDERKAYLRRQIQSITCLEITKKKGLPTHICTPCIKDLDAAIQFRQRCIISQKQFAEKANTNKEHQTEAAFAEPSMKGSHNNFGHDLLSYDELKNEDSDTEIEHFFEKKTVVRLAFEEPVLAPAEANPQSSKVEEETSNSRSYNKKRSNFGPYVCDECGRAVKNLCNFREHQLRHTGIKRFQCSDCIKLFATRKELNRHRRCHTGERPYGCRFCSSRFSEIGVRQQHERRHTNDRCYKCDECGKRFVSASCLNKHMLIHNGQRNHHCATCNQWFLRLTHLQAHMRTQTHQEKLQAEAEAEAILICV